MTNDLPSPDVTPKSAPGGASAERVALIGAGRVGTAVAVMLHRAGRPVVSVSSRTPESAQRAASRLGVPVLTDEEAAAAADIVLLGVTEGAIAEVVRSLAPHLRPGAVVWHLAGAWGLEPLGPALQRGARGAALHPLQACPTVEAALDRLPGSAWGVTCSSGLDPWAHAVIRDLEGFPVNVAEADRPIWHAAATSTSNGIAALMAVGEGLLGSIGVPAPESVLAPLAAGTVANARAGGGGAATLTGPTVRGEVATIERHLESLKTDEQREGYLLAARLVLGEARRHARIEAGRAADIQAALDAAAIRSTRTA